MARTMRSAGRLAQPTARGKVVLTRADYDALLARIEDLEDVRDLDAARADPTREELPVELVKRLIFGKESKIAVWREHRGLTARALADKAGVSAAYLSEIETGKKPGSVKALSSIAHALGVEIESLIDYGD